MQESQSQEEELVITHKAVCVIQNIKPEHFATDFTDSHRFIKTNP